MNYRQTRSVLGAIAVAAALTAGSAHAGGLTILPDAISLEYFGLNFANNILTSQTIGTLDYGGHPGCGGICVATTALGASPSVSVQVNEVVYQATGGGAAQATLGYYVEYVNTPGTYAVDLHASDLLSPQGSDSAQAYLRFGIAGQSFGNFNNFQSITFQETDCAHGCSSEISAPSPSAFQPISSVQMIANTLYFVQMKVSISPGATGVQSSASIDPTFTTDALGGTFLFSPGVTGRAAPDGVPEPAAWALMVAGFGLAGTALRTRRRQAHPAQS
jgi:hypothetical protein